MPIVISQVYWTTGSESVLVSAFISLVGVICALALCGCCCIPCIRSLCERVVTTAVEKKDPRPRPPPYLLQALQMDQEELGERDSLLGGEGDQLQMVVWKGEDMEENEYQLE